MAERFAFVFLFLVMVCGTPVQKLHMDVAELEEILQAITAEDLDLEYVLRDMSKQCLCQGTDCLCCASISVFSRTLNVCVKVTHALGMFTLSFLASNTKIWSDANSESSVRKLIGTSETVKILSKTGFFSISFQITFHDIQMTSENVVSSCVDGNAVFNNLSLVISQNVTFNLGCFTI